VEGEIIVVGVSVACVFICGRRGREEGGEESNKIKFAM